MSYAEDSIGKSFNTARDKHGTSPKVPLRPRLWLSLAFVVLPSTLVGFFGFSAIAQDAPSELKLADDIHETVDKVPVTVTVLSEKTAR
jgi:hypothetical protein